MTDVNLNRLTESLKFIEDIARFQFKDRSLLAQVREMREELLRIKRTVPVAAFIAARRSRRDPGRPAGFDRRRSRSGPELIMANLTRAKESSRTLEELFKTADVETSRRFKEIRFKVYDLERTIAVRITREFDPRLCTIIDEQYLAPRANIERITKTLVAGGATMIQLRVKTAHDRQFLTLARRVRAAIARPAVKFIVNDRPDIALASHADGVHVGPHDMPVRQARELMGDTAIIGVSANDVREARRAEAGGADYLGTGALYRTSTKHDARPCTLATLRKICQSVRIPVIGIGGIDRANFQAVRRAGAAGIAVASYLFEGDLKERMRSLTPD